VVSAGFRHYRFLVELRDRYVLDLSGDSDRRIDRRVAIASQLMSSRGRSGSSSHGRSPARTRC
jgi:hypothetical protein